MDDNGKKRITIFGDIFLDIMATEIKKLPTWGTDTLSNSINMLPGGSAFNTCVHAAKFTEFKNYPLIIRLCGAIGEDSSSQIFKDRLHEAVPIIEDGILACPGHRTGKCVVLSSVNDRCFVTDRGVVDEMDLDWFSYDSLLPSGTEHIHIGGYFNLSSGLRSQLGQFLKNRVSKEVTISITPQFDATLKWEGLSELSPFLTYIICNENEICAIAKRGNAEEAAFIVLNWGFEFVVVTLGKVGSIVVSSKSESIFRQNAIAVDNVVDTTGAGDSFAGAFIVEYTLTKSINNALLAGAIAAAACISVIGGSITPQIDTLQKLYCLGSNL